MRPLRREIPWLTGVLGAATAIVACSEIAGLGPPLEATDSEGGAVVETGTTGVSDTYVPDSGTSDVAAPEGGDGGPLPEVGPGSLDRTFGDGGTVTLSGGGVGRHGLAVQPDNGNIVYCGKVNSSMDDAFVLLVGRLTPDGSLDTAFNTPSGQLMAQQPGYEEDCSAVALMPDGSIVAAGRTNSMWTAGANYQMVAARFTSQGTVDTTFGDGSGFARVDAPTTSASSPANAMVLHPDGSMTLGGVMVPAPALARLSAAGAVDPTFGSPDAGPDYNGGVADDAGFDHLDVLALADAGAITQLAPRAGGGYVATSESTGFLTLGITAGGAIDPSYGNGGQAWVPAPAGLQGGAIDMVIQSDGRAVCVGYSVGSIELVRFETDGGLDMSFGQSGHASVKVPLITDAIAQLLDGRLVVAVSAPGFAGVVRFTAKGDFDTKFGVNGYAMFPVSLNVNSEAIAVDGTGRIYLAVGVDSGIVIFRILS